LPTAEKTNDSQKCGLSYFLSFVHFCSHFSENAKAPATPVFLVSNTQKVLIFQWVQGIVTTVYCFDVTPKWNSFEITRKRVLTSGVWVRIGIFCKKGLLHKEESQCSSPFYISLGVKMWKTSVKRVKC